MLSRFVHNPGAPLCRVLASECRMRQLALSIDARIEKRQHFLQERRGRSPDPLGSPCPEVNGLDLLHHDESRYVFVRRDRHVEWVVAARVGDGADDGEARVLVEEAVADHKGGPASTLLVPGLPRRLEERVRFLYSVLLMV